MQLEHPLSHVIARCETHCVKDCCGRDAFDFSPIHISSALRMFGGLEVEVVREQLAELKRRHGSRPGRTRRTTYEQLNQNFSPEEVDALVEEIAFNLAVALDLNREAEARKWKPWVATPDSPQS